MSLSNGTKLGPYEILSPLGAGGMDEVYRAKDTKLHREVAIKVLPANVASSSELLPRFEREATTVDRLLFFACEYRETTLQNAPKTRRLANGNDHAKLLQEKDFCGFGRETGAVLPS